MRTWFRLVLAAGLTLGLTVPALTQAPQRGFGGGFGMFGGGAGAVPLNNKSVQEELKLTPQQIEKVKANQDKQMERQKENFAKLKDLSQEERREKMMAAGKAAAEEAAKFAKETLTPDQQKRYRQLQIQQLGMAAFQEEDVQKKIALTDDQKEKIKLIGEDFRKDGDDLRKSVGTNFQELFPKMAALRKEANERALAVLKDDQKKAWKELTGAPFEMKMEFGQFGGGRPKKDKN